MELITMRELFKNTAKYADTEIEIGGWVRNRRVQRNLGVLTPMEKHFSYPLAA